MSLLFLPLWENHFRGGGLLVVILQETCLVEELRVRRQHVDVVRSMDVVYSSVVVADGYDRVSVANLHGILITRCLDWAYMGQVFVEQ